MRGSGGWRWTSGTRNARIQIVVFEALKESEDGRGFFTEESEVIQRERAESDDQADDEGDAMAPPRLEKFVEAEGAPPLPETV
jgi:hypothetical protein